MTRTILRIATRSSALALWQANHVADLIRVNHPGIEVALLHVSTEGDRNLTGPLREFGGEGVFTREVQRAVLDGRAELAVHSLKDLPTVPTEGLLLAAVPDRASTDDALVLPLTPTSPTVVPDPRDLADSHDPQVSNPHPSATAVLAELPLNSRLGTGSPRRRAQLLHFRPDLKLLEVRGNLQTRLAKLDAGEYDGLVLAVAGLSRIGLEPRISATLAPPAMYPAVGQGALGIECAAGDEATIAVCRSLTNPHVLAAVQAERQLLAELRAGCHAPLGVSNRIVGDQLNLEAVVLSLDGQERLVASASGPLSNPQDIGIAAANELRKLGAERLVRPGG